MKGWWRRGVEGTGGRVAREGREGEGGLVTSGPLLPQ